MRHSVFPLIAVLFAASPTQAQSCPEGVLDQSLDPGVPGPTLWTPNGAPVLGGDFSVQVREAAPFSLAVLLYSPNEAPVLDPVSGATFYPGSPLFSKLLFTGADGLSQKKLQVGALDPELCGAALVAQAVVFDSPTTADVTNALRIRVGEPRGPLFPVPQYFSSEKATSVGDVDSDGRDEVLASNFFELVVHECLDDGTLDVAVPIATGAFEKSIVADMNGDDIQDVVAMEGEFVGQNVAVILGQGGGSFAPPVLYPIPCRDIAVADFDGDDVLDVVVSSGSGVGIRLGAGDGTLGPAAFFAVDNGAVDLAVGDLNNDGVPDVVAADLGFSVAVLFGTGDGSFAPEVTVPTTTIARLVEVGDFVGGTALDIAIANGDDEVEVLRGAGDGTFTSQLTIPTDSGQITSLLATEVDQDGRMDLIVGRGSVGGMQFDHSLRIHYGKPSGGLGPHVDLPTGYTPRSAALVDVDLDGFLDVVCSNNSTVSDSGTVSLFHATGEREFLLPVRTPVALNPRQMVVEDFDGDGLVELASASASATLVRRGGGNGAFGTALAQIPGSGFARDLDAADWNGDGAMDLARTTDDGVRIFLNDGSASFTEQPVVNPSTKPRRVATADFDLDGALDLVATIIGETEDASFWPGNGDGTFDLPLTETGPGFDYHDVAAGDVDADGVPDAVFTVRSFSGFVDVKLGNGDFTFASSANLASAAEFVQLGDIDGDGDLDVIYSVDATSVSYVGALVGNGDGTFGPEILSANGDDPSHIALADIDDDGFLDTISHGAFNNFRVSRGNGDGTFATPLVYATQSPITVATADVDRDGIADVLVCSYAGEEADHVSVYLNLLGE